MRKLENNSSKRICAYLKTYVSANDLESIQTLLTKNPSYDINTVDDQGNTILHWAMQENVSVETFKEILKLENLNLFLVNIKQQFALQVAIEQKQSAKIALLLQSAVDHKVLPELNNYLQQAIDVGDAASAKVLLLYGAEVDATFITQSKNSEIILLFCQFGYGIGAYFKNPEVLKTIEFSADTCLVGAFVDGKKIESELTLSAAILEKEMLNAANTRLSLVSEVRQNQALTIEQKQAFMTALLARMQTEWSYWRDHCKDPIQIHQALVDQNWDQVSAWLKGLNADQVNYVCFLQVMLKQKSQQIDNIYLQSLVKAMPQPVLSLRSIAFKKIKENINQHRYTLADVLEGLPALLQEELCYHLIAGFSKNKRESLREAFLSYLKDKDFDAFSAELKQKLDETQFIYLMSWFNRTKDNVAMQNTANVNSNLFSPMLPAPFDPILLGYQEALHLLKDNLNKKRLFWASRAMQARMENNATIKGVPFSRYVGLGAFVVSVLLGTVVLLILMIGSIPLRRLISNLLYSCSILDEEINNGIACPGRKIACQRAEMILPSLNETIRFAQDGTPYECVEEKPGDVGVNAGLIIGSIFIPLIVGLATFYFSVKHVRVFPYGKTLDCLDDNHLTAIHALKILLANLALHYHQQPEAALLKNAAIQLNNPKLTVGALVGQLQKVDSAFDALGASGAPALVDRGVCFYPEVKGLATLNSDLVELGIFAAPKPSTTTNNNNNEFELVEIPYTAVRVENNNNVSDESEDETPLLLTKKN